MLSVFREHGYAGASLSVLSRAAGKQRASLYHRFPAGKEEMAEAVIDHVAALFACDVLAPLRDDADPEIRVRRAASRLKDFYGNGDRPCILDALSLGCDGATQAARLRRLYQAWRDAFAGVAHDAGATTADAERRASRAIALIEGSLVTGRVSGDRRQFLAVLDELPALLTEPRSA